MRDGLEASFSRDLHILHLKNRYWVQIKTSHLFPSPRYGHCLVLDTKMKAWYHGAPLPPKPTDVFKKLLPILESIPIAFDTSSISAPVFSQSSDRELIEDILWAKKALAVNFESSDDHKFVVRIFFLGTHEE